MILLLELGHEVDGDLDDYAVECQVGHPVDCVADAPRKREHQAYDQCQNDAQEIGYCGAHSLKFNLAHYFSSFLMLCLAFHSLMAP